MRRATFAAFGIALFFLVAGPWMISYLGVTVHAFAISGGFSCLSPPMLFGHRAGLQAPEHGEERFRSEDIAIFTLAIPLLFGPGTITTILLLSDEPDADAAVRGLLAAF